MQDFKRVVKLLQEHDIDIAKLILINQNIDEDFMNELYGDDCGCLNYEKL